MNAELVKELRNIPYLSDLSDDKLGWLADHADVATADWDGARVSAVTGVGLGSLLGELRRAVEAALLPLDGLEVILRNARHKRETVGWTWETALAALRRRMSYATVES
jgi:hypothetical protein